MIRMVEPSAHCEFNSGVFRAKLATSDFDTSHIDVDGGLLQIDVGASNADIFTTAGRTLSLDGDDGLVLNAGGPITISSQSAGDLTLSADGDLALSAAASVRVGLTSGSQVGFFGSAGTSRPTIMGAGDARLTDLLGALDALGLIDDQTT